MKRQNAILTTSANISMSKYHDCMPVHLSASELETWMNDPRCVDEFLRREQPALVATKLEKQKSLKRHRLGGFETGTEQPGKVIGILSQSLIVA